LLSTQEPFAAPDGGKGEHNRHAQQPEGVGVLAELHVLINRERDPATMMVAPNSPSARANASSIPPMMPRAARGTVMVKKTRQPLAPSVRAICSRRGLTSSKATRAERINKGADITLKASKTARQVKIMSRLRWRCRKPPRAPWRPKTCSRIKPTATGGMTRGNVTTVSRNDLPGQSVRASIHANARPNGRIITVLNAATQTVKPTICHSRAVMVARRSHIA
jgi:hypothetical protein